MIPSTGSGPLLGEPPLLLEAALVFLSGMAVGVMAEMIYRCVLRRHGA